MSSPSDQKTSRESGTAFYKVAFLSTALIVTAILGVSRAQSQPASFPVCSADMFDSECANLSTAPIDLRKSTSEADGNLFNYFAITQPERRSELRRFLKSPSLESKNRTLELAESVRASAIDYITAGADEASWSAEVTRLVQRLRTVAFRIAKQSDSDCASLGDPAIPNARYLEAEHTVSVCPSATQISTAELASLLAHEIGHTVSPCQMSKPLLRFNPRTPAMGRCLLRVDDSDKASLELLGPGSTEVKLPTSRYGLDTSPNSNAELVRCKAAESLGPSAPSSVGAYRAISACLAKTYGTSPDLCAAKSEEHFADSFGAFAFANFAARKDMSRTDVKTALHARRNIQCAEIQLGRSLLLGTAYPPNQVRLMLQLKPRTIADRLSCSPSSATLCSLTETTFAPLQPSKVNGVRTTK